MLKLGILDFGFALDGSIERTNQFIDNIKIIEDLGFSRFWLGEHFSHTNYLHGAEILITLLCQRSKYIKVGIAGILILLNNPYRVALNYKLLESLFPGRIDLGIARGTVDDEYLNELLGCFPSENTFSLANFEKKLNRLLFLLENKSNVEAKVSVPPIGGQKPQIWLLGMGNVSASLSVKYGTSFCYSIFLNTEDLLTSVAKINKIRESFILKNKCLPEITLSVAGTCSNDYKKISRVKQKFKRSFIFPSVLGSQSECVEQLLTIKNHFNVEEIMFLDISNNNDDKLESYRLLSEALLPREY